MWDIDAMISLSRSEATMNVDMRINRLRAALVDYGERRRSMGDAMVATHTDFHDFSEKTGPGDREPNFTDFVQKD